MKKKKHRVAARCSAGRQKQQSSLQLISIFIVPRLITVCNTKFVSRNDVPDGPLSPVPAIV